MKKSPIISRIISPSGPTGVRATILSNDSIRISAEDELNSDVTWLTSDDERDGVAGPLALGVGSQAGEVPGSLAVHALQHQAVVAQDHARRDVVMDLLPLEDASNL